MFWRWGVAQVFTLGHNGKGCCTCSLEEDFEESCCSDDEYDECPVSGHLSVVNAGGFSPDGKCVVSGSNYDKVIIIWSAETGAEVRCCVVLHRVRLGSSVLIGRK